MSEPSQTVDAHYDAIKRRDLEAILQTLAKDVVWEFPYNRSIPFSGRYEGREAVRKFFSAIRSSVEVREFSIRRTIAEGDTVVVFGHERFLVKRTDVEWSTDWIQVHTVDRGQITMFREYADTSAIVLAYQGIRE